MNQQHVQQLQQTFSNLRTADKTQLRTTITRIVPTTTQVPDVLVTRLVDDMSTHLVNVNLTPEVQTRLANAFAYVLATPSLPEAQVVQRVEEVKTILVNAGVPQLPAQTIACDLHLIGTAGNTASSTTTTIRAR